MASVQVELHRSRGSATAFPASFTPPRVPAAHRGCEPSPALSSEVQHPVVALPDDAHPEPLVESERSRVLRVDAEGDLAQAARVQEPERVPQQRLAEAAAAPVRPHAERVDRPERLVAVPLREREHETGELLTVPRELPQCWVESAGMQVKLAEPARCQLRVERVCSERL